MLHYLLELRHRVTVTLFFFGVLFIGFFWIAPQLLMPLASPLLRELPPQAYFIITRVTSPLVTPMRLALDAAMLGTAPFALYQIWLFVSPALHRMERHTLRMGLFLSMGLFCLGALFCFYCILPWMFHCFVSAIPTGLHFMPDVADAIDFIMRMLVVFGCCFEVPLLCVLLVRMGWLQRATLVAGRPYAIVGSFIVGMLLTPPDVVSQLLLAIPLCLLYELGIWMASCTNSATDNVSGRR